LVAKDAVIGAPRTPSIPSLINRSMKISATSALVLNWTEEELWETPEAMKYFRKLDLSEGQPLLEMFDGDERYIHTHAVSNRKFFMKQQIIRFLESLPSGRKDGQVLILAAGLTPLSFEIASLYPLCRVFDVDRYLMKEKMAYRPSVLANIEFIECDLTDVGRLHEVLLLHGFDPRKPAIAVMEGIIYYLTTPALIEILKYLSGNGIRLVGDFCLKPELVNAEHRIYPIEVFRKISEMVGLESVTFYSEREIGSALTGSGFGTVRITGMRQIQKERTGAAEPFNAPDSGWLRTLFAA